jgi:small GTP-binding protein
MTDKKDYGQKVETIKIGSLGNSEVGKTQFCKKYTNSKNNSSLNLTTVGFEFYTKEKILSNGKKYKINIYDTAGQEKYRSLSLNSIRNYDGVFLMYDITNFKSFDSISEWIKNIYEKKDENYPLILIGNKCDLKDGRKVSEEEGLETAEKYKTKYFETSAKEGINVEEAIDVLLNKIINKKKGEKEKKDNNLKLDSKKKNKKKRFIC